MNKEFLIELNYDNRTYKFYIENHIITCVYNNKIVYFNKNDYCRDKYYFNKLLYSSEYIVFSKYTFSFCNYKPRLDEYWNLYLKLDDIEELKHNRLILDILE